MLEYFKSNYKIYVNALLLALVVVALFFAVSISLSYGLPIFIAFLFYVLFMPLTKLFNKRLSYKFSAALSVLIVSVLLFGIVGGIGVLLYVEAINVFEMSPIWLEWSQNTLLSGFDWAKSRVDLIPNSYVSQIKDTLYSMLDSISNWSYDLLSSLFTNITSFSVLIGKVIVGYILSIFLILEAPELKRFISNNVTTKYKDFYNNVLLSSLKGIGSYIKAQIILVICAFVIIFVALFMLGVDNALLISFISASLDLIPLLGVSTIFIPWIIYLFIFSTTNLWLKIMILWLVVILFRQVMEPRITGDSLGVSPFIMLASMLLFTSIFGLWGLILSPVILLLIKSLFKEGYIKNWLFGKPLK